MTPIISPWVFYLMPICDNVGFFAVFFGLIGFVASCIMTGIITEETTSYQPDEKLIKMFTSIRKKIIVATVICGLLGVFLPSENTITKMIIAQNVTYERVEVVDDTVKTVYNDIMDLFEGNDE